MNKEEALKMAIEALEKAQHHMQCDMGIDTIDDALEACKEALAQPAQEPDLIWQDGKFKRRKDLTLYGGEKFYTHPAPACQECENLKHDLEVYMDANKELINREWQGLSDDEIARLVIINEVDKSGDTGFAKLIEQALKEKNHG